MVESLQQLGAPLEVIEAAREQAGSDDFEVLPENWETVQIFLHLATCWSTVALGLGGSARYGIPATEIESTLRLWGARGSKRKELFLSLRMMEQAALEVFVNQLDR